MWLINEAILKAVRGGAYNISVVDQATPGLHYARSPLRKFCLFKQFSCLGVRNLEKKNAEVSKTKFSFEVLSYGIHRKACDLY